MKDIHEIHINDMDGFQATDDILKGRAQIAEMFCRSEGFDSQVTIWIQAFNRIEKTKACIESVLKYTTDVDFNLLLVDSGSSDGTFEYFKSIEYDKVRVVRLDKNISSVFPHNYIDPKWIGRYLVILANDIIVTKNWLRNLLTVAESDERIGIVNPVSSNTSNLQCYNIPFKDSDEMQKKAEAWNKSDPTKWHERMRIITLGTLYKREALYAIGWPVSDVGFAHDFSDDDIAFRVRRAGYKVILAKDTWVHHNHNISAGEDKDPQKFVKSLQTGRMNFREKYFGVDAWDDVNEFILEYLPAVKKPSSERPKILGVDVKCGTPILEIKNKIREFRIFDAECKAFTENGKYFIDLQTVCGANNVKCADVRTLNENYEGEVFDYIVLGKEINLYPEPEKLLKTLCGLLKKGGQLFTSVKNTYDIAAFLMISGQRGVAGITHAVNYTAEEFFDMGRKYAENIEFLGSVQYEKGVIPENVAKYAAEKLKLISYGNYEENLFRIMSKKFAYCIEK